jgi:hypothetical protein
MVCLTWLSKVAVSVQLFFYSDALSWVQISSGKGRGVGVVLQRWSSGTLHGHESSSCGDGRQRNFTDDGREHRVLFWSGLITQ